MNLHVERGESSWVILTAFGDAPHVGRLIDHLISPLAVPLIAIILMSLALIGHLIRTGRTADEIAHDVEDQLRERYGLPARPFT